MRKRVITAILALVLLLGVAQTPARAAEPVQSGRAFYSDVALTRWSYPQIRALFEQEILPAASSFRPADRCKRIDFVESLYRLHLALGGTAQEPEQTGFEDVAATDAGAAAVVWASKSGIANGVTETKFGPHGALTRQQCCVFLLRFARAEGLKLRKSGAETLFTDAVKISEYARSDVLACRAAGIVDGYSKGDFQPSKAVTREESAVMLYRFWQAALLGSERGSKNIRTEENAYLDAYEVLFPKYDFTKPAPAADPVSVDWFKDAVFIGDSVSVRLQMYASATGALGRATFLCSTSLSAPNALMAVTGSSFHPSYNGTKMKVEDAVAACGAKNVYIMLGINSMRNPVESSADSLVTLIGNIKRQSPNVNIIIQSVTPMTSTSNILAPDINNSKIERYNQRMLELCATNGWYFVDVASVMKNANGDLNPAYCGDTYGMGIHFTTEAARVWVDYLFSHVPSDLK